VLHTESSRGFGGQELRTVSEAAWLTGRGVRIILAGQPGSRILEEAARAAIGTVDVTMRGAWDLAAVLHLARLIRGRGIDVVHTHSSIDAWVGGCAARVARVPVVRSRHVSIPIRRRFNPVYTWLADRVVASGEAIRQAVLAAGARPEAVVAIPAGVDLQEFAPGPPGGAVQREFAGGRPVVGSVAMFRGSKGHEQLLEAFQRLRNEWPGARLLLVGDGVRRRAIEERVRAGGLTGPVRITGFRRDVADLLRLMDCFVLASTRTA
jgi:glycosyltransferase involved in cell wall biosynthesis